MLFAKLRLVISPICDMKNYCRNALFSILLFTLWVISAAAQSNWSVVRSGTNVDLVAVYFTSDKNGWIAGDNGYLAATNDGGATWTKVTLDTKDDINEIYFRNSDNGYLVAGRVMYLTHDGGRSW